MTDWQPLDEGDRLETTARLVADRPDIDWTPRLAGSLAGPPSPDRPDVPVWEYPALVAERGDLGWEELAAVRFPIVLPDGVSGVTSIDEELAPPPRELGVRPRLRIEPADVARRYAMLRDAGAVEWVPAWRGIRYLVAVEAYRHVVEAWGRTLPAAE